MATAYQRLSFIPPDPDSGAGRVGESDHCLTPKRGFPLPTLPMLGEEVGSYALIRAIFGS